MSSLTGLSKDFVQDEFTSVEIQQAIDRGNGKYGMEVSYCPSHIKVNSIKNQHKQETE